MTPEQIRAHLESADAVEELQRICAKHDVFWEDVVSRSQKREFVAPRHELWRRLHAQGYSQTRIGEWFGVHASTVNTAVKRGKKGKRT